MNYSRPQQLHELARCFATGDTAAQLHIIEAIGLNEIFRPETILLACCVGGPTLTGFIAALGTEHSSSPEVFRRISDACADAPAAAGAVNHDADTAKAALTLRLIDIFGLKGSPDAILLHIKDDFLLASQSPVEILKGAASAMEQLRWAPAATGFLRAITMLGKRTPKSVFAQAAACLHRLGRFDEATALSLEGLGPHRDLIALKTQPLPEQAVLKAWGTSSPPLVSVLCMTFNHARYLDQAIRGFLTQRTTFPFEVLIHDDASNDGTQAIIRRWHAEYPHIIRPVLQSENQYSRGIRAFETLLRLARGHYVATCEGDDYWIEPLKLQKQVAFLEQHREFSCSGHSYYLYNESRLSIHLWDHSPVERIISPRQLMNLGRMIWLPSLVFRRHFSEFPPERAFSPIGDQFLSSYLGTFGPGIYFENFLGSVRRENPFSAWTPLSAGRKEYIRVKTRLALVRLHENLGNPEVADDLQRLVDASSLDPAIKAALTAESLGLRRLPALIAQNE